MIEGILLIFVLANCALSGVLLYLMINYKKSQALQMMYLLEKQEDFQSKLSTVGTVLKIFEEETKILQRRNEANTLKQRFQPRQPR